MCVCVEVHKSGVSIHATDRESKVEIYPLVFRSHSPHSNFLMHHLIFGRRYIARAMPCRAVHRIFYCSVSVRRQRRQTWMWFFLLVLFIAFVFAAIYFRNGIYGVRSTTIYSRVFADKHTHTHTLARTHRRLIRFAVDALLCFCFFKISLCLSVCNWLSVFVCASENFLVFAGSGNVAAVPAFNK